MGCGVQSFRTAFKNGESKQCNERVLFVYLPVFQPFLVSSDSLKFQASYWLGERTT